MGITLLSTRNITHILLYIIYGRIKKEKLKVHTRRKITWKCHECLQRILHKCRYV